jgi:hypothetical protein
MSGVIKSMIILITLACQGASSCTATWKLEGLGTKIDTMPLSRHLLSCFSLFADSNQFVQW